MSKVLSVEIGNEAVKIVEGYRSVSGRLERVCSCMTVNIPADSMDEGRIINMEAVAGAIREALSAHNIRTKRAVLVIGTNAASARRMVLHDLDKKSEIMSMIRLEVEHLKPSINGQIITYEKMQGRDAGDRTKYVVYSLSESVYEQYKELAKVLGLKLTAMDTSANYLKMMAREGTKINGIPCADGVNAFINIEQSSFGFYVINKGANEFSRVVYLNEVTDDAGTHGTDDINDMDYLAFEIEKNIRYYYSSEGNSVVDKVYVYGPGTVSSDFCGNLSLRLGVEVESIVGISGHYTGFNVSQSILNEYIHGVVSLCAGSRDEGFLSEEFKVNRVKRSMGAVLVMALLFFAFFTSLFLKGYFENEAALKAETARMKEVIKAYEESEKIEQVERLKRNVQFLKKYNECGTQIREIASASIVDDNMLRMLMEAKPAETSVVFLSAGEGGIQIRCRSGKMEEVIAYLEKIRSMSFVERVHVPEIDADEQMLISYSIVCGLKDVNVAE